MAEAMSAEKLEKIVLMLSSDQPGDVFAAAQAIGRLLPANKLDWHKFAKLVAGRLADKPAPTSGGYSHTSTDERAERRDEQPRGPYMTAIEVNMVRSILQTPEFRNRCKDNERSFLQQMDDRHDQYADKTFITVKQREWLYAIWERF